MARRTEPGPWSVPLACTGTQPVWDVFVLQKVSLGVVCVLGVVNVGCVCVECMCVVDGECVWGGGVCVYVC